MIEKATDDLGSNFAERTKEIMRRKKVTRDRLSTELDISTSTLATYLRPDSPVSPPLDRAIQISEILGEPLEYLCGLNKVREFREKELLSEVVLKNLAHAIRDAKLSVNFQGDKITLESNNNFVVSFMRMIGKNATIDAIESGSKRFQNIKFWKGVMVSDDDYEELRYLDYLHGDIADEDADLYHDEMNELIELRKRHWEETGGQPTEYLHEEEQR